jgi:HEAT repeat protein
MQWGLWMYLDDLDEPANHPFAVYCLNQLGSEAVEPLMNLLRTDDDPDARFGAAHALGGIGDPKAIPALMDAFLLLSREGLR